MRFYTLKEKTPEEDEVVLIKLKNTNEGTEWYCPYYITRVVYNISGIGFEEASGECYTIWYPEDILGWTSISEIKENEKWN